jgi:hypothetical protein
VPDRNRAITEEKPMQTTQEFEETSDRVSAPTALVLWAATVLVVLLSLCAIAFFAGSGPALVAAAVESEAGVTVEQHYAGSDIAGKEAVAASEKIAARGAESSKGY